MAKIIYYCLLLLLCPHLLPMSVHLLLAAETWAEDMIFHKSGKVVFNDKIISRCQMKSWNLTNSLNVSIDASPIRNQLRPENYATFDKCVADERHIYISLGMAHFASRCVSPHAVQKRGLGRLLTGGVKLVGNVASSAGKAAMRNKGSVLINCLSFGTSIIEIRNMAKLETSVDLQRNEFGLMKGELESMKGNISTLDRELEVAIACTSLKIQMASELSTFKSDADLLLIHGKIVDVAPGLLGDSSKQILSHEINLKKCDKDIGIVRFSECKTYAPKEAIYDLIEAEHVGDFNGDSSSFSLILFNNSNVKIDGRLIGLDVDKCEKPSGSTFFDKVHRCPKNSVIVPDCTIDSIDTSQILTTAADKSFFQFRIIGDAYMVSTLLKAFTIVSANGSVSHQSITTPTFLLTLPLFRIAAFPADEATLPTSLTPPDYGVGCSKPAPYWRSGPYFTESKCAAAHPSTGCERWGLFWYEVCSQGYYNSACCICTHYCPGGLIDTGASCTKKTYGRGVGTPLECAKGLVEDAALCYPPCQDNYNGVGPVCWDTCPEGKFGCGALCLDSKDECVNEMLSIAEEVAIAVAEIASDPEDAVGVLAKTVLKLAPQLAKPICPQTYE